jgi:hypothetical protein
MELRNVGSAIPRLRDLRYETLARYLNRQWKELGLSDSGTDRAIHPQIRDPASPT